MAYKRWSDSNWYIFWHVGGTWPPEKKETKEDQLLAVWYAGDFSLPTLTYEQVLDLHSNPENNIGNYIDITWEALSKKDKDDLITSIEAWLEEVNELDT